LVAAHGDRECRTADGIHTPATTDLPITMRLAEPPQPFYWLKSA
jgi:hypothetical protein